MELCRRSVQLQLRSPLNHKFLFCHRDANNIIPTCSPDMETLLLWLVAVLLVNDSLFGWGYEVKSSSSHHGSWETITDNPTACELWVIIETLVFAPTETGWQRHTDSADASRLTSTSGEESSSSVKQPKGSPGIFPSTYSGFTSFWLWNVQQRPIL